MLKKRTYEMLPYQVYINFCTVNRTFDIFSSDTNECLYYGDGEGALHWLNQNGYVPVNLVEWRLS